MKEYFHGQKGVTLIEVLASIVILAIILLTSMSFFTSSSKFNSLSSNKMDATNIARETQEEFKLDAAKNKALKDLIDQAITNPGRFPLTSFPNLVTSKDIELVSGKLKFTLNKSNSNVVVSVDLIPVSNQHKKLYTMHVEVWNDNRKLSETFTYFEY
ncbi:type IV pilus modification PilV family protein [Neobacillus drentensis]|uniref:type IV pilus modification PilV family protein n=1 Tax=Neobacillus drentensis TaxID=220684 RepID=UPI0028544499|nr:prepilin-type N-terminal cleavage/methylation domain-containing protein [Neobacillus drentensis]MDR7237411.1 prepilin-type N-terminal cleavage/methylation domain-containing protein [Neobacillus drentensis]